jgi:tRNA A-37 threonylcarbamoyl transferase component Bud32
MRSFALGKEPGSSTSVHLRGTMRYTRLLRLPSSGASHVSIAVSHTAEKVSKVVVLKTLHGDRSEDPRAVERLLFEARLTARMNHPNVVQVLTVCRDNALPVIVMEYLAGQSLATLLSAANDLPELSLPLRIGIVTRLLTGLHYAHCLRDVDGTRLGVVHGGVSPDNVVITYDGQVKLIDFGRAKLGVTQGEDHSSMSRLPYLAPEQFGGKPDMRGDVFAVGAVLWEMVAKRQLWGQVPAPVVVRRLLAGDIPRLRDAVPSVDGELDRICSKALAPQPDGRYPTAAEMREDLERYVAQRGGAVSEPALGALVCNACSEQRRQVREMLDARLSELGLSWAQPESNAALMPVLARPFLGRRLRDLAPIVLGSTLVVALLSWKAVDAAGSAAKEPRRPAAGRTEPFARNTAAAEGVSAQGNSPAGSAEPATRLIKLEVAVQPQHALLYLDGQPLSSNPLSASMVWDPLPHTIVGQADGFEAFSRTFRLDSDVVIDAALRPQASEVPRQRSTPLSALAAPRVTRPTQPKLGRPPRARAQLQREPLAGGMYPKVNILSD